ncbi:MAG: sugar transferase [Clostridiales bacterium]|nr:sugar transferase [Clostridiales bacterium]
MHSKHRRLTNWIKYGLQAVLYVLMFICFFSFQAISNPQLLNLSRTAVTTTMAFILSTMVLSVVYGGFDIGIRKKRSVLSSMCLTFFITDIITYLFLQIMNVNPQNPEANKRLTLLGEDLLLLIIAIIVQMALIYLIVSIGHKLYYRLNPPKRSLIITSSQELANQVASKLEIHKKRYRLCECVHYECPDVEASILAHEVVFLAGIPDTEEGQLESFCYQNNKSIYLMAELEDVIISTAHSIVLDDMPFLNIHRVEPTPFQLLFKRIMDITISLFGLIVFSPLMLIAAIAIKLGDNGPVFFRQQRATINGNIFSIVKFRTMSVAASSVAEQHSATKDDDRVTRVGRFLRASRIDELPQLWNVLKGDMSIVGPRPEMLENVNKYTAEVPEFRYRQQMKAGMTGLAQIEGKYNTSPKDKAMLDLIYIEQFSLAQDLKLMLRTLTIFFRRDSTEGFGEKQFSCPKMRVKPLLSAASADSNTAETTADAHTDAYANAL